MEIINFEKEKEISWQKNRYFRRSSSEWIPMSAIRAKVTVDSNSSQRFPPNRPLIRSVGTRWNWFFFPREDSFSQWDFTIQVACLLSAPIFSNIFIFFHLLENDWRWLTCRNISPSNMAWSSVVNSLCRYWCSWWRSSLSFIRTTET